MYLFKIFGNIFTQSAFLRELNTYISFNHDIHILVHTMFINYILTCRFKSSVELMLCVIDISTLNKTYLI